MLVQSSPVDRLLLTAGERVVRVSQLAGVRNLIQLRVSIWRFPVLAKQAQSLHVLNQTL